MTEDHDSTAQQIALFEQQNGFVLPQQYKRALVRGRLGRYRHWMFEFTDADGFDQDDNVTTFFSFKASDRQCVPSMYQFYIVGGRVLEHAVPIAASSAGDLICIDLHPDRYGAICYWDHELNLVLEADEIIGALAPALARILNMLQPYALCEGRRLGDIAQANGMMRRPLPGRFTIPQID